MLKKDKSYLYNIVSLILFIPNINYFLSELLIKVFNLSSPTPYFYIILYLISFSSILYLLINEYKLICKYLIFLSLIILELILFDTLEYSYTKWDDLVYNSIYKLIIICVPLFLLSLSIDSYEILLNSIYKVSIIIIFLANIVFVIFYFKNIFFDYMSFSYDLLVPAVICFYKSILNKKRNCLVFSCFSFFIIAIGGCRGALLCLGLFLLLFYLFISKKKITINTFFISITIIFSLSFMIVYFELVVDLISSIFSKHNYQSRIMEKIIVGEFFKSQGRDEIYSAVWAGICEKPFLGYGLFGDRKVVSYKCGSYPDGTYSHNIVLEILCEFGFVFGSLILICIFLLIFNFFKNNKKNVKFDFCVILISCELLKLFYTGSYLVSPLFWLFLGLLLNRRDNGRKSINNNACI